MLIRYENSIDDVVAFTRYHCKHSRTIKAVKWSFTLLIVVLVIGFSLITETEPASSRIFPVVVAILLAVLAAFVLSIAFDYSIEWQARRMYKEGANKGVFGQHELEIHASGLVERTEVNETRASWQGIEQIVETPNYAFIYMSAMMAHVIPKRSVSVGDAGQFISLAKEMWLASNQDLRPNTMA